MAFVYSCCFWFSLRLGGIIIGIFSLVQATLALIAFCVAHAYPVSIREEISDLLANYNLVFAKTYFEHVKDDPQKWIVVCIILICIYILTCVLFIYGALTYSNTLMIGFIIAEFIRLAILSSTIIISLLVLKQNTMDIGQLIGASVASGFFLLGMYYLWICAANLPILINEMEEEEKAETIRQLRKLIEGSRTQRLDAFPRASEYPAPFRPVRINSFRY